MRYSVIVVLLEDSARTDANGVRTIVPAGEPITVLEKASLMSAMRVSESWLVTDYLDSVTIERE